MKNRNAFLFAVGLLTAFLLWTAALCRFDVRPIGPAGSAVGFSALNAAVHRFIGVHWGLYILTDWLGLIPLLTALGFALLGLGQWIKRRSLRQVDRSILVLGGFYGAILAAFIFFQRVIVNYRPVLIEGVLEASYPSSTTLLTLTVMPTALLQLKGRIKSPALRTAVTGAICFFVLFTVAARTLSGVHWITDIIGGSLLSAGLVFLYCAFAE